MNSFLPRQVLVGSNLELRDLIVEVVLQVRSSHIQVVHRLGHRCAWAASSDDIGSDLRLHRIDLLPSHFGTRGGVRPSLLRGRSD